MEVNNAIVELLASWLVHYESSSPMTLSEVQLNKFVFRFQLIRNLLINLTFLFYLIWKALDRKELEKKIEIKKIEEIKRISEEKKKLEQERARNMRNIKIIEKKIELTDSVRILLR